MKYEIMRNDIDQSMGFIWWDEEKKSIEVSDPKIKSFLKLMGPSGSYSIEDGLDYLKNLPRLLKSGYVSAKKVP